MYLISHSRTSTHVHQPILLVCRCQVSCTIVHIGTTAYLNFSLQMLWGSYIFCVSKNVSMLVTVNGALLAMEVAVICMFMKSSLLLYCNDLKHDMLWGHNGIFVLLQPAAFV